MLSEVLVIKWNLPKQPTIDSTLTLILNPFVNKYFIHFIEPKKPEKDDKSSGIIVHLAA